MSEQTEQKSLSLSVPRPLVATLERLGWEVRALDFDLERERAVLELKRFDGRWLYLATTAMGGAIVERWHRDAPETSREVMGKDRFLGRDSYPGARGALRMVCTYLAENPAPGCAVLPSGVLREAMRFAMRGSAQEVTNDTASETSNGDKNIT